MLFRIVICILAGVLAGLSTGFAGLSAAAFIAPMLVAFLNVPVYDAVGIALASDVLASGVSAFTYAHNGNIDFKHSRALFFIVLICTVAGSALARFVTSYRTGDAILSYWSIIGPLGLGIFMLITAGREQKNIGERIGLSRKIFMVLCAAYIGLVCGFQGSGGGMMLLFTLTVVMLFDFKKAVGTSVFIMTFTALIGAVSHFLLNGVPDFDLMLICIVSTTVFARIGAAIANRISPVSLKRITGAMLTASGLVLLAVHIFF